MVRPGEHEVREAELADRIQSLKFERFEEVEGQRIKANRPVNRIRNRLQIRHPTRQPVPAYIDSARPFDGPSVGCRREWIARSGRGADPARPWTSESSRGPTASG